MAPALAVRGLRHAYGATVALDGVTMTVGPSERVALLGRNGSGKTTLLRIASTLIAPEAGRVEVCGLDVQSDPDAVRRRIGVVFQSPALDGALTVREALSLQAALSGVARADRSARLGAALEDAGLTDRADDRVAALSGGLARRLDLARGLVARPALALLDEPTSGLDPIARDAFWSVLDRRRPDGAQLIATHLMDEAERCDRVVILDQGRVVADGSPHELTADLGDDALWLDTDDADALARALQADGLDARTVSTRVVVRADAGRIAELYARPDVSAATVHPPGLADVFAAAVGGNAEPARDSAEAG